MTIIIDDKTTFNAIGADVILNDCVIESSVPASSLSIRARIIGGSFESKVQLNGFSWCEAHLEKVAFSGRYRNNRFGLLPEYGNKGAVHACDFSSATLDDCEFYNCDVDSLVFPAWPHLTVLHPKQFMSTLDKHIVTDTGRDFFDFLQYLDDDCKAIVRKVTKLTLPEGFPIDDLRAMASLTPHLRC